MMKKKRILNTKQHLLHYEQNADRTLLHSRHMTNCVMDGVEVRNFTYSLHQPSSDFTHFPRITHLCWLVVCILPYQSSGPGSIPVHCMLLSFQFEVFSMACIY